MHGINGKQKIFSIDHFVIIIAWLAALFATLYYNIDTFVLPVIIAFLVLNIAILAWIHKCTEPPKDKRYKKYLAVQTVFTLFWCALLGLIMASGRIEFIPAWATILAAVYICIAIVAYAKVLKPKRENREIPKKKKKKRR